MKKFLQANRKPPVHKTCINNLYLPFSFMVNIVVGRERREKSVTTPVNELTGVSKINCSCMKLN